MASRSALVTVLFTDVVGSTEIADELGDRKWRELLSRHNRVIRRELKRFGGREIDTAGDGFFATFDRPTQAVRCAVAASEGVRELGLELRAGVHVGEIHHTRDEVTGIAVHLGARIGAAAGPGEVLVSDTVRQLTRGSGIVLEDRGTHALKGVPESQALFSVSEIDGNRLSPPLGGEEARARRKAIELPAVPIRRRRVALTTGIAAIAAVSVTVALIAVTREDPPPRPPGGGELHGAAVRIDPEANEVTTTVEGLLVQNRLFGSFRPQIQVGEGGVWVIGGRRLQHIDPQTHEVTNAPFSLGLALGADMTIGLHEIWVLEGHVVHGVAPGSLEVAEEIELAELDDPSFLGSIAVSGGSLWLGSRNELGRIDPLTATIRSFEVDQNIDALVATRDGLILVDELAGRLALFDPKTAKVLRTIELQTVTPDVVAAAPDGDLWVLDTIGRSIHDVSLSGEVGDPIGVGEDPTAIAVGDGVVWVADEKRQAVLRIDPDLREVVATIPLGGPPSALAVDPDTGDVWVYLG